MGLPGSITQSDGGARINHAQASRTRPVRRPRHWWPDFDTARALDRASGHAVIAAPVLDTLSDSRGVLPDVVLTDGPPALFVMPERLIGTYWTGLFDFLDRCKEYPEAEVSQQ